METKQIRQETDRVITAEKIYHFSNGDIIRAQFSDTQKGLALRLVIDNNTISSVKPIVGNWNSCYESITIVHGSQAIYIMGTGYGLLPKDETPFQLIQGKLQN